MRNWTRLDLRKKSTSPPLNTLVALRLVPNNERATFYTREYHDIGCFKTAQGGRKAWWHGSRRTEDPTRLRKHHDIWWCYIPIFDGW